MPKGVSPADFERFTTEIYAFYADAEQVLLEKVARRLARGITEPGWAEAKLAETQALRAETLRAIQHLRAGDEQAARAVMEAYKDGSAQAVYDLEELLRTKGLPNGQPFVKMALPRTNQDTVQALARKLVDGLQATQLKVLRDTDDVFRQAIAAGQSVYDISRFRGRYQGVDVGRQAVAEAVGKGMVTGAMNRREATQDVLNRFADRGITGFVDKAGRNWDLASYAEMAVRSATGQASIQGHMDKLLEHGYTLFIVSDSPEECDVCRPWERAVLAATDEAMQQARAEGIPVRATVAQAIAAGLFHANCSHRLGAYIHGLTEDVNTGKAAPDLYEDRQHQRYLERQVRRWKRREAAAMTPEAQRAARQKVNEYQTRIRLFIQGPAGANDPRVKAHGWRVAVKERTRRNDREQVRRGEAGKVGPRPRPPLAPTIPAKAAPQVPMPPVPQAAPGVPAWKLEAAKLQGKIEFEVRNGTAGRALDDVLKLGKVLRQQVEPTLRTNAEQYAALRQAWRDAEAAYRHVSTAPMSEAYKQANDAAKRAYDAMKQLMAPDEAARKLFGELLAELRPMGHVSQQPWHTGSLGVTKELVEKVKDLFPREWLERAYNRRLEGRKKARGEYNGLTLWTDGTRTTTWHEYMHHMERMVPGIRELEKEFHTYRAKGETPTWLGKPYGRNEIAVRDKFVESYMGKVYRHGDWEIMSMGGECVFYHTHGNLLLQDEEYLDFVLGVMAGV